MKSKVLIIASLTSAFAMPGLALAAGTPGHDKNEAAHCFGVNTCKGVGDCGGKGHTCAGKNSCKGQGYLEMSKDLCLKIDGGRLTENPEPAKSAEQPNSPKKP